MKKQFILVSMIFLFGLKARADRLPKSTMTKVKIQKASERILKYFGKTDPKMCEVIQECQRDGNVSKLMEFFKELLQERKRARNELEGIRNFIEQNAFPEQLDFDRLTEEEKASIFGLIGEIDQIACSFNLEHCTWADTRTPKPGFLGKYWQRCNAGKMEFCALNIKHLIKQIENEIKILETAIEQLRTYVFSLTS